MSSIVSFFDQFPEFAGVKITVRGDDGYFDATEMGRAMTAFDGKKRRFSNWTRSNFAQRLLSSISAQSGIPVDWASSPSQDQTPLIDYVGGTGSRVWIHPYVAEQYARFLTSKPKSIPSSFVYLLQAVRTNHYKIGISCNPNERFDVIQSCCPLQLKTLLCFESAMAYEIEQQVLSELCQYRRHGEWLYCKDPEIIYSAIQSAVEQMN